MQSPVIVHGVPFKQEPRNGQRRVFDKAIEAALRELNVKLPTGYGKTFTAAGVYSIRQKHFGLNRLLFITPTVAQHEAFCRDGHCDLSLAGVVGPDVITDIGLLDNVLALKRHRANSAQIFAVTVQGLCSGAGATVNELLQSGRWMVVVDEYHHYGIDKAWGLGVRGLNHEFLLAMSATPHRPNEDSAFGAPAIEVGYREAVDEKAVKELRGHSYIYKIDAIDADGGIKSMTTSELAGAAGSMDPEQIEKYRIERKMRWSPKYVSPLVSHPIERMLSDRVNTGYRLQAIIGAMCVSHAELVCDQLKAMFPELAIDWVGTGTNGRARDINQKIIAKFCPPKKADPAGGHMRGEPELDVLVHVGMAGEGLDTCNVSEIVHLNAANINNSNNQENGRASRYLGGVVGNINYDSSSEYSAYVGRQIMSAMDFLPPGVAEEQEDNGGNREPRPLPEEFSPRIWDMELLEIDSGSPGVERFAKVAKAAGHTSRGLQEMREDPDQNELEALLKVYRNMLSVEAERHNEKSVVEQWKDAVSTALSLVTGRAIKAMQKNGQRIEKSLPGDIKKRVNGMKKGACGAVVNDVETLKRHYTWLQKLEAAIISKGIPAWLQ